MKQNLAIVTVVFIKAQPPVSIAKDKQISGGEDAVLVGSHLCWCKVILLLCSELGVLV